MGEAWSDAQRETMCRRLEDVLVAHWDADGDSDYSYTAADARAAYEEYLDRKCRVIFEEIELELSDDDIKISENGSGYVSVSVEIDTMTAVWQGDGECLFFGEDVYVEEEGAVSTGTYRGSYAGWMEMELHRVNGEWRVLTTTGYFSLIHRMSMTGGAQ